MKRRLFISAVALSALTLGGCGSLLRAAIETPFIVAHHTGNLAVQSVRYSVEAAKAGFEVGKVGVELAGGVVKLADQMGQAGHNGRMRDLQYQQAMQKPGMAAAK